MEDRGDGRTISDNCGIGDNTGLKRWVPVHGEDSVDVSIYPPLLSVSPHRELKIVEPMMPLMYKNQSKSNSRGAVGLPDGAQGGSSLVLVCTSKYSNP
jgi:hypothetical protein